MRVVITVCAWFGIVASASTALAAGDPNLTGPQAWKDSLHRVRTASAASHANQRETRDRPMVHGSSHASSGGATVYTGSVYTIESLIARVQASPGRFARQHGIQYTHIIQYDIQLRAGIGMNAVTFHGLITDTPYHRYLKFRRSLDPARFDHYHPILGPLLAEDNRLRALANHACYPPLFPPLPVTVSGFPANSGPGGADPGRDNGPGGGGNPDPGVPHGPTAVPEPAALVLLAIGAGACLVPRIVRRGKSAAAESP